MARTLCERCGAYPFQVELEVFDEAMERRERVERMCAGCWTLEERRRAHHPPGESRHWRAGIPLPGFSREAIERTLAFEQTRSPAELAEIADALIAWVIEYRRKLPPELEGFVRRHRSPAA